MPCMANCAQWASAWKITPQDPNKVSVLRSDGPFGCTRRLTAVAGELERHGGGSGRRGHLCSFTPPAPTGSRLATRARPVLARRLGLPLYGGPAPLTNTVRRAPLRQRSQRPACMPVAVPTVSGCACPRLAQHLPGRGPDHQQTTVENRRRENRRKDQAFSLLFFIYAGMAVRAGQGLRPVWVWVWGRGRGSGQGRW